MLLTVIMTYLIFDSADCQWCLWSRDLTRLTFYRAKKIDQVESKIEPSQKKSIESSQKSSQVKIIKLSRVKNRAKSEKKCWVKPSRARVKSKPCFEDNKKTQEFFFRDSRAVILQKFANLMQRRRKAFERNKRRKMNLRASFDESVARWCLALKHIHRAINN